MIILLSTSFIVVKIILILLTGEHFMRRE